MYKETKDFHPFRHENLDFKNNIIATARKQDLKTVAGAFTAVLIYANVVDYIAKSLVENIKKMISIDSLIRFGGIFFYDGSYNSVDLPLGKLIVELKSFEFPDKKNLIQHLDDFNRLRTPLLHNLMKLDPKDTTGKLDKNVVDFNKTAEEILSRFNIISTGMTTAWNAVYYPQTPPQTNQPQTTQKKLPESQK